MEFERDSGTLAQVMKLDAGEAGPLAEPGPERELIAQELVRSDGRGKHEGASPPRPLSVNDCAGVCAQEYRSRSGLAVAADHGPL